MPNPFFEPLPDNGVINFAAIEPGHYSEAFEAGFAEQSAEITAIVGNGEPASFANTVEALERSGATLERVVSVFFNLTSSDTNEYLQTLEMEIAPRYAVHRNSIYLSRPLFERVDAIMQGDEDLNAEQRQCLAEYHRRFIRAGADLSEEGRRKVDEYAAELARLETAFSQNVLKDTNAFKLVLESEDDLAGLPQQVREMALSEGEVQGLSGKHVFTLSRSSITPFLQFSSRRDLREKLYTGYTSCGTRDVNNHELIADIIRLRDERAKLLGFVDHASFMLDDRMAKTPEAVNGLLDQIWAPAKAKVEAEAADLQAEIQAEGGNFALEPWDWWYYTEKIRSKRYGLDDETVKPYFKLENVRDGVFAVAKRLYGITFERRDDLPVYHDDVEAYEVTEASGEVIGIFLFDFFMRPSKRGGAWMNTFRDQSALDGHTTPVVVNCCNFPKSDPCLLGMDEVRTLFHEFGHGLHGLLSKVTFKSLSGTNVKQDFVELPSQIMEHWAMEPDVMRSYATHYQTGEVIPDDLIEKLNEASTFNQGFATTEYLAASYLDLAWHTEQEVEEAGANPSGFEARVADKIGLIREIDPRYKSSYFQHIFSGEHYSAGYYVYIWAEVLDADGYEAFRENGVFDEATASSFRSNILEKGGSADPMDLYVAFRGREADVEPLLRDRGLIGP